MLYWFWYKQVKYDDLTHSQWIAGVTTIAAEETDRVMQNMIQALPESYSHKSQAVKTITNMGQSSKSL